MTKVPQYFEYFNWYDLDNPLGIHDFIQEMKDNGVSIEDFPDIHIYYDIMYNYSKSVQVYQNSLFVIYSAADTASYIFTAIHIYFSQREMI